MFWIDGVWDFEKPRPEPLSQTREILKFPRDDVCFIRSSVAVTSRRESENETKHNVKETLNIILSESLRQIFICNHEDYISHNPTLLFLFWFDSNLNYAETDVKW